MIRALVIDDEESGRIVLEELIKTEHQDVQLLPSIDNLDDAVKSIDTLKPDLIFLDIKLGDDNGFEVLEQTSFNDFHVIFVTAYSEYAIQAIKASALDYLLKPIGRKDLASAIDRFKSSNSLDQELLRISNLLKDAGGMSDRKLTIPSNEGYELVTVQEILYLVADRNYSKFYFADGSSKLVTRTMGFFEDQLSVHEFLRIHKSHMVNLNEISLYTPGNGGSVKMSDGKRLQVSKRKKKELLDLLNLSYSGLPV